LNLIKFLYINQLTVFKGCFLNISQWNIAVFAFWQLDFLMLKHFKSFDQFSSGVLWKDHFINKTALCRTIWIGKFFSIFGFLFGQLCYGILGFLNFLFENDFTGTFSTHYSYLCTGP